MVQTCFCYDLIWTFRLYWNYLFAKLGIAFFLLKISDCVKTVEQAGAAEPCLAHNPEVGRAKLPPTNDFLAKFLFGTANELNLLFFVSRVSVNIKQLYSGCFHGPVIYVV